MRRLSGDARLTIALLVVLTVILIASAIWQTESDSRYPPLVSLSNQPDGSRALRLSLEALGFQVTDRVDGSFSPPGGTRLALLLEPFPGIVDAEWQILDDWVEQGGTLILAGEGLGAWLAAQHYGFQMNILEAPGGALIPQAPLLTSPLLNGTAEVKPTAYYQTERGDYIVYLAVGDKPVLVSFEKGEGRYILCACAYPFSNAGLKETGNPSLVLNLVSWGAKRGSLVWFDEWHHGLRSAKAEIIGPENWLRKTPTGHALLYMVSVVFLALVLQGRSFGRPVPLARQTVRRAPLEHITAIANLNRRAGHRPWALHQYHSAIKRFYTRRYRINPSRDDREFVQELSRYQPDLDAEALLALLQRLSQPQVSEYEMIRLAAEAVAWLETQNKPRTL